MTLSARAADAYKVGDVVTYQNPSDGSPLRRARITRIDSEGKLWLDFKAFQPELNGAEASKQGRVVGGRAVPSRLKPAIYRGSPPP